MNAEINTAKISDESEFILRLQNGDAASYETLVRHYGGKMLAVAKRYFKNDSDAEDCVQDAYIQAFRSIHSFEGRASLYSWLHRIVMNAAFMKIRAHKRRPEEFIDDNLALFDAQGRRFELEDEITLSSEDMLVDEEARLAVRGHIEQLPETLRNLLLLRDIEGYITEQSAELLGISPGAIKTGLHRARKLLKKQIIKTARADERDNTVSMFARKRSTG
jgi:RNA polymerase sigma-70 factor (ECF subfamily)